MQEVDPIKDYPHHPHSFRRSEDDVTGLGNFLEGDVPVVTPREPVDQFAVRGWADPWIFTSEDVKGLAHVPPKPAWPERQFACFRARDRLSIRD